MRIKSKVLLFSLSILVCMLAFALNIYALTHSVISGDSMWKIAKKYQVPFQDILSANPQIENPDLIYPKQMINIPASYQLSNAENSVITLVNQERKKAGLSPLSANWELARIARTKSNDMATNRYFSHTSPTYGSPFQMIQSFGIVYSSAGENIAMGQKTPEEVMRAWMNSSGHRQNILNSSFTEIGVGLATNASGQNYWTQMFIRPK